MQKKPQQNCPHILRVLYYDIRLGRARTIFHYYKNRVYRVYRGTYVHMHVLKPCSVHTRREIETLQN